MKFKRTQEPPSEELTAKVIKAFICERDNRDVVIAKTFGIPIEVVNGIINKYIRSLRRKMKRDGKII